MDYIAHTLDGKTYTKEEECQSLQDHLTHVAKLCEQYASAFGAGQIANIIGLLHDYGKYDGEFQRYIRAQRSTTVNHKTAGAIKMKQQYGAGALLLGLPIHGHHGGLHDLGAKNARADGTYLSAVNEFDSKILDKFPQDEITIPQQLPPLKADNEFSLGILIRMLYSCLIDGDRTDTEEFCTQRLRQQNGNLPPNLFEKLMQAYPKSNGQPINEIRQEILQDCLTSAEKEQGLFTLTVPTGGGKTLSSLAFALKHAQKHGLRRVIYVIPYTSITQQNAAVFRERLGDEIVLEHHSNVLYDHEVDFRTKWATENWEIPIVVTTNVQFFESFYSANPSACRKLHNLANSVIIFDEAQNLPLTYLSSCMMAISELIKNYGVTAVLCSATQPTIGKYLDKELKPQEISAHPDVLAEKLKRVCYEFKGKCTDEALCELLSQEQAALIIVNSRRHAYFLYQLLSQKHENVYHLSTTMHYLHRQEVLQKVKERLKEQQPTILVSTQLIEAGVDIDFPLVVRSMAGIDSVVQAAGRANREGKCMPYGRVWVFEPDSPSGKAPKSLQNTIGITQEVMTAMKSKGKAVEEAFSLEGIRMYFQILYHTLEDEDKIDPKHIVQYQKEFRYKTIDEEFKLIDEKKREIVVCTDDTCKALVEQIRSGDFTIHTMRQLGRYTVSVYEREYRALNHVIEQVGEHLLVLTAEKYYSNQWGIEIFTQENLNAEAIYP